jgi:hypothetical protein
MPNKRYEDYKIYMTIEEEDAFLLATNREETD